MDLAKYSIQICRNEKCFPKSQRWILAQKIANTAIDACGCIREANATFLNIEDKADVSNKYRRNKQIEGYAKLNALLTYIEIAYNLNNINGDRIRYWTELTVKTLNALKAWMISDQERLK